MRDRKCKVGSIQEHHHLHYNTMWNKPMHISEMKQQKPLLSTLSDHNAHSVSVRSALYFHLIPSLWHMCATLKDKIYSLNEYFWTKFVEDKYEKANLFFILKSSINACLNSMTWQDEYILHLY